MTVKEVIDQIARYQDYGASESMKKFGYTYKLNYGVSIVTLKHLSNSIPRSHKLAMELWKTEIREAMILATMIANPNEIKKKEVRVWSESFTNPELVEQACSNLLYRIPFWNELVEEWLVSEKELLVKAGLHIILKKIQNNQESDLDALFERIPQIIKLAETDSIYIKKSVVLTLQVMVDMDNYFKESICEQLNNYDSMAFAWLKSELWWDQ